MENETPSTSLRNLINKHGQLHLDKERTSALLKWMEQCEEHQAGMMGNLASLVDAIGPVVGRELHERLKQIMKQETT